MNSGFKERSGQELWEYQAWPAVII